MGFIFNDITSGSMGIKARLTSWQVCGKMRNFTTTVPGKYGVADFGADFDYREITVHCNIYPKANFTALVSALDDIAAWLDPVQGLRQLIFDDVPDRYFMARLNDAVDCERLIRSAGSFDLKFFCPDPFGYAITDETFFITEEGTHTVNRAIKNGTKSAFRCSFYGIGDKDKMDQGAAMFFFNGASALFVDMEGNAKTLSTRDSLVEIPKGAEGYLLFDFADFQDGWHNNAKLDLSKTDLFSLGYRLNDGVVSVRYTITLDHVFLYGKNISHVPGTISMKTTTPTVSSTASKPAATSSKTSSKAPSVSTPGTATDVSEVESVTSEITSSEEIISSVSSEETIVSTESVAESSEITAGNDGTEEKKMSPLIPILIIAIILVVAVGAIVIIAMMKKKKETAGGSK